ncbi:MAG: hypothetical protein V7L23_29410 [Nostoc sp.]|uniref:hypothetical protein n=1 Tax=Nostoc sp. TaxID=1180 RepID=UPI002FF0EBA2
MTTKTATSTENVQIAIDAILRVLGEPQGGCQWQILDEFKDSDVDSARITALTNLADNFCKSLGFLVSAKNPTTNIYALLSAAANAAVDHAEQTTLIKLGEKLGDDLKFENPSEEAIRNILKYLSPDTEYQTLALELFNAQNYDAVKKLAVGHLEDHCLKALTYLSNATKLTPAFPAIIAEAAREAAKHVRAKALRSLNDSMNEAFN